MRKAFTLIEVMVVLSILAIIAALSYNFFGSTMKEARLEQRAVSLFKSLKTITDAYHETSRITGTYYDFSVPSQRDDFMNDALSNGVLKSFPENDPDWFDTKNACTSNYKPGMYWGLDQVHNAGPPGLDPFVYLYCIDEDLCKKYNELYTDRGSDISEPYWTYENHGGTICSTNATAWGATIVAMLIDIR